MINAADNLLNEMKNIYEEAKRSGKTAIKWEELPPAVRAYIKSRIGVEVSGLDLGALSTIIQQYEREIEQARAEAVELTEEEEEEIRRAIEEVEKEFKDPTVMGSDDYKEAVKSIAEIIEIYEDKDIRPGMIAELLLSEFNFATISDTEEIYIYSQGAYRPWGETFIKRIVQDIFREAGKLRRLSTYFINETLNHIRRSTLRQRSEFDKNPFVVNVKNGLLNIRTLELKPHDPDYLSIIQLPVEWNPKAKCPRWDQFLQEIVEEEDARVLQEFIGYTLWRDCRFQKALMLTGSGLNGKSTFLNVIAKMLGEHNCSFRPLQELMTNRFATADLFGKLANIYNDLPPNALLNTGLFKILVSGEEIQAEKKFKNAFKFKNFAKLMFSANKVPSTVDDTKAFFRRWIIINFPNEFKGDQADPHLEDKLSTPQCLSYVLKWAVEGLKRLLEQGRFSYYENIDEIEDMYMRASNPAYAFFADMVEEDPEAAVPKDVLYRAFIEYCKQNKLPTLSKVTFANHVKKWTRATDGWIKIEGRAVRAWRGIRLKDQQDQDKKEEGIEAWVKNSS